MNEKSVQYKERDDSLPHDIEAENRLAHPDGLVDLDVVWNLLVPLG